MEKLFLTEVFCENQKLFYNTLKQKSKLKTHILKNVKNIETETKKTNRGEMEETFQRLFGGK